jgi:hypothetical protein
MQYIPDHSQSNYLVSNDDLSVMDLPRNMGPAVPVSNYKSDSTRQTPLLVPPLKYIVYNNPQVVYDFLINKGYNVENNIPSTYQFAKIYVREQGEPAIVELVKEAHPDLAIIKKALGLDKKDSSYFGLDMFSKKDTAKTETPATPVSEVKKETDGFGSGIKLNTQTVIIALIIVVFFLLINRANK